MVLQTVCTVAMQVCTLDYVTFALLHLSACLFTEANQSTVALLPFPTHHHTHTHTHTSLDPPPNPKEWQAKGALNEFSMSSQ